MDKTSLSNNLTPETEATGTSNGMKRSIFILFILCLFLTIPTANAQVGVSQSDINVNMTPDNPGPNESVNVYLTSYSININTATITWRINGKVIKSGKGEKTFTFTTGDSNTTTSLGFTVQTQDGQSINNTISIKPVNIDLVWQSESFVPPFYKGKALFSHQNKITFIAIPHMISGGVEVSPKNLIYTWKKNGSAQESNSGYGKNTYSIVGSLISRPFEVEVEVTSVNGTRVGFTRTTLNPTTPNIVLYEKSPTNGIGFQKALQGTVELTGSKEISVVSVPFFFGVTNARSAELLYKWSINGAKIDEDLTQPTRVFRQIEGTSGISNISISVENNNKVLQLAGNNFNLKFGSDLTEENSF